MIQPINGGFVPNQAQFQQATAPIAEVGGNDLQSPPSQRVQAADELQAAPPPPPEGSGRGSILDISV